MLEFLLSTKCPKVINSTPTTLIQYEILYHQFHRGKMHPLEESTRIYISLIVQSATPDVIHKTKTT